MLLQLNKKVNLKSEILAGLTVAMTMIPESLSFAILAGLSPLTGLYAAFIMGLVTAVLGGRPGMVSGGAGATIVVMIALIRDYGVEYLFAAVILAGLIQILVGLFRLGKFVRLIPQPVMYGFLNGLAIIIFMSQVEQFKVGPTEGWLTGTALYVMLGFTALTVAVVLLFPKISKAIPASLVAIIVVSLLVFFLGIDTRKVGDIARVSGSLPSFHIPQIPIELETIKIILPYAAVMAGVGLIESLLTLQMTDEITQTRGHANREATAQGIANMANGFFGGMGGCAMVAQTLVNLNAGARSRLAGIVGAITILLVILVGAPLIEQIPMAALAGVMMIVAAETFQWVSLRIINKMPLADIFVGIVVAAITVILHNLALAVLVGVIIAALVFAWDNARRMRIVRSQDEVAGETVYKIRGILFFGSVMDFTKRFSPEKDSDVVLLDFRVSRIADMSGIDALEKVDQKYKALGKKMVLIHLNADSRALLQRAQSTLEFTLP